MTDRRRKLLVKVEQNVRGVSPQQMDALLRAFGFEFDRQRGSHIVYRDRHQVTAWSSHSDDPTC